jgi:hypothetical protein
MSIFTGRLNQLLPNFGQDSENNTILMLLAETKPPLDDPYSIQTTSPEDRSGATMRMARLYYDRYHWILDWSNSQGKTALHIASLNNNEELVRVSCYLGDLLFPTKPVFRCYLTLAPIMTSPIIRETRLSTS